MTPCLTGCRTTGAHHETCPGTDCAGCLPRPAVHGRLCSWCWSRLTEAIDRVPALLAHLREIGEPAARSRSYDRPTRGHADPSTLTVLPAPWLAADDLLGLLESWAGLVADEHPRATRRTGDVVSWLTGYLPWCAGQEWAGDLRREVCETVGALRHRYPAADEPVRAQQLDRPCPACGLFALYRTPPRAPGDPVRVECSDPDCARVFSEDEWEAMCR